MKIPAAFNELLQKPMDRKEFLKHTAAMTLFVAGGAVVAQSVAKGANLEQGSRSASSVAAGYGANVYGGSVTTLASKG